MPLDDCAVAEAAPLVAVIWTGWPHADEPLSVMLIQPVTCDPADIASCWQVAPVLVGWQFQPYPPSEAIWPLSPNRLPLDMDAPAGSVTETVSSPVWAEPESVTWKLTKFPP